MQLNFDLLGWFKGVKLGPDIRKFFINTLFDSTFVLLGIVVGSAFVATPELKVILGTMLVSSLALGISTGVSVYEAESLGQEMKLKKLEKAMLTDLRDTNIAKSMQATTAIIAIANFFTPLFVCSISISPFLLSLVGIIEIHTAAWISIAAALATLFAAGFYITQDNKTRALFKGIKMTAFGCLAFLIGFGIELLI
jgi:predicted membrane protein (TIGR00267 family)